MIAKIRLTVLMLAIAGCPGPSPTPTPTSGRTTAKITNQGPSVTIYAAFGADSAVTAADWSSFCSGSGLSCNFTLGTTSQDLPTSGKYLNVTLAAGGPVGCGVTKAELNINNPSWYDIYDVSLVDGFNARIEIDYVPPNGRKIQKIQIGPPAGRDGNEKLLGVYPYGCDICVARQKPSCGIAPGVEGCKAGTQYDPRPPCQYQGLVKGGGGSVEVILPVFPATVP